MGSVLSFKNLNQLNRSIFIFKFQLIVVGSRDICNTPFICSLKFIFLCGLNDSDFWSVRVHQNRKFQYYIFYELYDTIVNFRSLLYFFLQGITNSSFRFISNSTMMFIKNVKSTHELLQKSRYLLVGEISIT